MTTATEHAAGAEAIQRSLVEDEEIRLGDRVRDRLTGIEGIAVAHTKYLTGCDRISILPASKDGKSVEWWNVDLPLIEKVETTEFTHERDVAAPATGGPQPNPQR